ncbi:MAG: pilus assembly protein PilM [Candidatus Eremiobacteraeota bacterium]|nr:pilus assembly protein PilM [Candidatus Eremiobacteraeota bacterium]
MKERRLPLGVDVGSCRIRVAALAERADGRLRVLDAVGVDRDDDAARVLRRALQGFGFPHCERRAVIALSPSAAPLRDLRLPQMSRREREQAVRFEGEALFSAAPPEGAGELVMRWAQSPSGHLLLAAARRQRIEELRAIVVAAGLRPVAVDHEALAWLRAGATPLLDIGSLRSTLAVSHNGVAYVRQVPFGGDSFTGALARAFALDAGVAEARKCAIGLAGAAGESLDEFGRRIDTVLVDLRAAEGIEVSRLALAGNGARLPLLAEGLTARLGVTAAPVELAARFEIGVSPGVERGALLDWFSAIAIATYCASCDLAAA